jgi:2-C-methyl-D-erythritol 4-phosphate cytidylyltransferase
MSTVPAAGGNDSAAILVAAGQGRRMGAGIDKLFLDACGRPVVAHAWARFEQAPGIQELVLVVRAGQEPAFDKLAAQCGFRKPFRLVPGGQERQDSVWNGLQALSPSVEFVAIHDAARPCVSAELIAATLAAARESGAAVAAQRVTDTIKESADGRTVSGHLDRSRLWAVQTPQCFRVEILRRAMAAVREKRLLVTDDTAACELIGQPVRLVESTAPNPKVTLPADLPFIETLLRGQSG